MILFVRFFNRLFQPVKIIKTMVEFFAITNNLFVPNHYFL